MSGRIFYGWYVAGVGWLSLLVGYGVMFYGYLIFFDSWNHAFGWSRSTLSGSYSAGILTLAVASPFVGRLTDRHGARPVMLAGSLVMGAGVLSMRWIDEPWQLYAAYILGSVGFAANSLVPVSALLARWFDRRRGLAVGITYTAMGAGGVAGVPLVSLLISQIGWRDTFTVLALMTWAVQLPTVLLVVRPDPYVMGLLPDGMPRGEKPAHPAPPEGRTASRAHLSGLSLVEAAHTGRFWMVSFLFLIALASGMGIFSQIQPFLLDLGYSSGIVALIFSLNGFAALVTKFFYGYLSDRVSVKSILVVATFGAMSAHLLLLAVGTLGAPSWLALIMSVLIGIAGTAFSTLVPIIAVQAFGLRHAGVIVGALGSSVLLGMAAGPVFMGAIYSVTGDYSVQAMIFIGALVLAVTLLIAGPPIQQPEPSAEGNRAPQDFRRLSGAMAGPEERSLKGH